MRSSQLKRKMLKNDPKHIRPVSRDILRSWLRQPRQLILLLPATEAKSKPCICGFTLRLSGILSVPYPFCRFPFSSEQSCGLGLLPSGFTAPRSSWMTSLFLCLTLLQNSAHWPQEPSRGITCLGIYSLECLFAATQVFLVIGAVPAWNFLVSLVMTPQCGNKTSI